MVTAAEEVVLAHFVEVSDTCEGGDVTAHADALLLGTLHHDCCVPTDPCAVLALEFLITGYSGLLINGNGVDVVGLDQSRDLNTLLASFLEQCTEDVLCALGAVGLDPGLRGIQPSWVSSTSMSFRPSRRVLRECSFGTLAKLIQPLFCAVVQMVHDAILRRLNHLSMFKRGRPLDPAALLSLLS